MPRRDAIWNQSHVQVPTAFLAEKDVLRIYYSSRDDHGVSRVSYIDVDPNSPKDIIYEHREPILDVGKVGCFDDCGVMPSWAVWNGDRVFLYYIGWNVRNTVPYYNSVGLAISEDKGRSFKRFSDGPLWDRNFVEPYFSASTCILRHADHWKCWYLSCTEYVKVDNAYEPRYHLKYCESIDGINWIRHGTVAVDFKDETEGGIVKASVIWLEGVFKMWFSYRKLDGFRNDRNSAYRIGYAESSDGIEWMRKDEMAGIDRGVSGWDSQMMAYPHVVAVDDRLYMFYNGNNFGKEAFGYAECAK